MSITQFEVVPEVVRFAMHFQRGDRVTHHRTTKGAILKGVGARGVTVNQGTLQCHKRGCTTQFTIHLFTDILKTHRSNQLFGDVHGSIA